MYRRRKSGDALSAYVGTGASEFQEMGLKTVRSFSIFEFATHLQPTAFIVRLAIPLQLGQRVYKLVSIKFPTTLL